MAQKVKFKRHTTAEIEELEVEDGALVYNIDNGKTYMDYGTERIQTGGNADTMISIGDEEPTDEDIKIWINTPTSETKASEIVNEYTDSDKVGYSCEYLNNNKPNATILWTNNNPTNDFSQQTIQLNSDDYDCIEILFKLSTTRQQVKSTGIIPKGYGSLLDFLYNDGNLNFYNTRYIEYSTTTSLSIANCYSSQGSSVINSRCIPLYIVGYKTGLFS